jgi:hypothetical protein
MDQITRVKDILSYRYPVLTVLALQDIADVCNVSYKMVLTFISLKRIQGEDIHDHLVEFVTRHRPDLLLMQFDSVNDSEVDGSWVHIFLAIQ